MNDPFQDEERVRELEMLVSPIRPRSKRFTDFNVDSDNLPSDISLDNNNNTSFQLLNDGHPQEIIQPSSQENTAQHKIQIESTDSKKEKEQQEELVSTTKQNNKNPSTQVVSLISNSKEEKVYCFFCHGKDDIVKCYGGCNRYFHLRCIGMKGKKDMKKWKCRACSGSDLRSSTFHKKHCLRNWYIRNAVELADGSISILIEGTLCFDESTWKCSPIDHLLDSSHFVTINHSIYTLIGEMDYEKAIQHGISEETYSLCRNGLPVNWRDVLSSYLPSVHDVMMNDQSCIAIEFQKSKSKSKKQTKETHDLSSPVTVIPLVTTDSKENSPAVRRSSRIRIPPLPFWKNEYLRINEKTGTTELIMGSSNKTLPKSVKGNVNKEELPKDIKEEESILQSELIQMNIESNQSEDDTTFIQPSFEKTEDESFFLQTPSVNSTMIDTQTTTEDDKKPVEKKVRKKRSTPKKRKMNDQPKVEKKKKKKVEIDHQTSEEDQSYQQIDDFGEESFDDDDDDDDEEEDFFSDSPLVKSSDREKTKIIKKRVENFTQEEINQLRRIAEEGSSTTNKEVYEDMSRRLGKSIEECKMACRMYHIKIIKMKKETRQIIPQLNQKLARKGTLKRKQQIRDLLSVIDNEDVEEKQNPPFDKKNLNADWEAAFRMKTPSIARKKTEVLNASFLDTTNLFEEMDDVEKDKIILSAEKIGKQKKKVMRGLPRVANDTKTMSKGSRGNVIGYFSKTGVPVVEVHQKEADLDDLANSSFSDSLLDDE